MGRGEVLEVLVGLRGYSLPEGIGGLGALALAQRFRAVYESSVEGGGGRAVPSLAARSAASFPGIFVWPGTQRMRIVPGWVCGVRDKGW